MPTYEFTTPDGRTFQLDSTDDLTPDELTGYTNRFVEPPAASPPAPEPEYAVQHRKPTFLEAGGPGDEDYLNILKRRLGEAGHAAINLPWAAGQVITGNNRGGRFGAGLEVLSGIGAPFSALASPLTAGVERGALALGADPDLAQGLGNVSEIPMSFGFGIAAGAGRFGKYGETAAKFLGAARPKDFVSRVQHGDAQLAYAASRTTSPAAHPLEELAKRQDVDMTKLALEAGKSPPLAQLTLQDLQNKNDVWEAHVKAGNPAIDIPPSPVYTHADMMEFSSPKTDIGVFSSLGTPSAVAMRTNPLAGVGQYDMMVAENAKNMAVQTKTDRTMQALGGRGDDTIREMVRLQNESKTLDDVLNDPNIPQDVKESFQFIEDKFKVDTEMVRGRLIEHWKPHFEQQVLEEMRKPGKELGEGVLTNKRNRAKWEKEVQKRLDAKIPPEFNMKNFIHKLIPGDYQVVDKVTNTVMGQAYSEAEAAQLLHRLASETGIKASDILVHHKTHWNSTYLKNFQGRTRRMMENMSQAAGFDEAKIQAAIDGDFGFSAKDTNFLKRFTETKGQKQQLYGRDIIKMLNIYDAQIENILAMTDAQAKARPVIREIQKRGYKVLGDLLESSLHALQGRKSALTTMVDNTLTAMPVVNKITGPYFADRFFYGTKMAIVNSFLRLKPAYHMLNMTQIFQTLAPVASAREVYNGIKLRYSDAGRTILKNHNVYGANMFTEGPKTFSSKLKYGLDRVLGASERFNQEVAFLTMYDVARRLGLDDKRAGIYGFLRGQVHSQFLGLTTDVPTAFRAIDPVGVITMFKRYPIKQGEMLFDIIKDRNFPAAAKWLATNLLLGGMKASVLGNAGWLTQQAWDSTAEKYGTVAADILHSGLPGAIGLDLSQSVMLYNPPFGDNWQERIGNEVGGVIGAVIGSVLTAGLNNQGAVEPEAGKRMYNALVQSIPVARELDALGRIFTGDYDFRDTMGRLKFKADTRDVIVRMLGAKSIHEGTLDTFVDSIMEVRQGRDAVLDYVAGTYGQARMTGTSLGPHLEAAVRKEVDDWNSLWPEFPISGSDIRDRTKRRQEAGMQELQQRILNNQPKVIKENPFFQGFRGLRNGGG